jgi:hypothetical protein
VNRNHQWLSDIQLNQISAFLSSSFLDLPVSLQEIKLGFGIVMQLADVGKIRLHIYIVYSLCSVLLCGSFNREELEISYVSNDVTQHPEFTGSLRQI